MPRIRRWYPVSHDFNRDREVQELRRQFGQWMGYVWLEMLSEADRNEGLIKGSREEIARGLAWLSLSNRPSYSLLPIVHALGYMVDKGWVEECTAGLLVRNYPRYHRHREQVESQPGTLPGPTRPDLDLKEPDQTLKDPPLRSPPKGAMNGFDAFWEAYPQKQGRDKAEESWRKKTRGVSIQAILEGIAKWAVVRSGQRDSYPYLLPG